MSENNQKITNACLLSEYEDIFICPICPNSVEVVNLRSLICSNHHCFDISKQGYVNLLSHPLKTKYDKKLFESRKMISQSGFFDPLIAQICGNMLEELEPTSKLIKILDAGCGEGSHLSDIQQRIIEQLVHMTPLSWGASKELIQQVLGKNKLEITFDFLVLLGKKMNAHRTN